MISTVGEYYLENDTDISPLAFTIHDSLFYLLHCDFPAVERGQKVAIYNENGEPSGYLLFGSGYGKYILSVPGVIVTLRPDDFRDVLHTRQKKGKIWMERISLGVGQKTLAGVV